MDRSTPLIRKQLEDLAARLAVPVRYDQGEMRGGLCRIGSSWQIIVNADLAEDEKAEVLAESLAELDLDDVYIAPRLRKRLEQMRDSKG